MLVRIPDSRLLAAAALFVLLGVPLLPVAQADAAGWRFDHGHLGAAPADHEHPWDDGHADAAAQPHEGDSGSQPLVFTMDDDGTLGAEPRGLPMLQAVMAPPDQVPPAPTAAVTQVRPAPEAPPPQHLQA